MKMNIYTFRLLFTVTIMVIVQCDLTTSLKKTIFHTTDVSIDPFEDPYLQTVLHMDRNALLKMPILTDDEFLLQSNELMKNRNGLLVTRNPSVWDNRKTDDELLSQKEIDEFWEEYLVAGPIAVNYISNLMVLSSKKDFPLRPSNPNYVYEHIKNPNSFRHTLAQVAGDIHRVFVNAHSNMDHTQSNLQQIPTLLKTILKLLTTASPTLIRALLPSALGSIERIAKQCADAAISIRNNYKNLTLLLQEVTMVTIDSYGTSNASYLSLNTMINSSVYEQNLLNTQLEDIRNEYKNAKANLQKAREAYYNAYHAIPTRPKKLSGMVAAGIVSEIVGGALGGLFGSKPHRPITNTAFQNAKETAQLALANLQQAEEEYDKWYTRMLEKQNKLAAIVTQTSQLHINQINYMDFIDILVSLSNEIGAIEKQWMNMTRFFTILAMQAEATRETVLHEFVGTINQVILADGQLDDADREYFALEMLASSKLIEQGAHLLYIMAKTYYDVSDQYMMKQISNISRLLLLQTDAERKAYMTQLAQDTLSTLAVLSQMALERKEQYHQQNQARQHEYKELIQQITLQGLGSAVGK